MSNPLLDDDWVRRESARLADPRYKPNAWLADIEEQERLIAEYERHERQVAASLPPPVEFYHTPVYGAWTEPVDYDPKPFPADGPVKKKKKKVKAELDEHGNVVDPSPPKSPPPPPPIPPAGGRQIRPIDID